MARTISELTECFRYGTVVVMMKKLPNGFSLCKRMRKSKGSYSLHEPISYQLKVCDQTPIPDDVVFIDHKGIWDLLRENPSEPMFKVTKNSVESNNTIFKKD